VVLGIYGISENNDRFSASTIRVASNIIAELKLLYNTQHAIAAGDYNAVLEPEDSSSQEICKRTTSAALHSMIDRHHLRDLARKLNRLEHTWFKMENLHTIFDHTYLSATLSPAKSTHTLPMGDYVIGSDEFLVKAINTMQEFVALTSRPVNNEEQPPDDDTTPNGPLDENKTFHNSNTNQMSLHNFNTIIRNLHNLHNEISKRKKNENNLKIRNISNTLRNLKHELKRTRDAQAKIEINNRLEEIQRTLAMETEAREKAAQMRISNFY
jgi:hypothetical protein